MNIPSTKTIALVIRTLLGLILLVSAGGIAKFLYDNKPTVSKSNLEELTVAVQVMSVEPVDVARQWRGYGTTQAKDTADVPARIGATVISIPAHIEVGKIVSKGQTLAQLDPTDFQNALKAAEKRITEANAAIDAIDVELERLKQRLALEDRTVELAQEEVDKQIERYRAGSASNQDVNRVQRSLIAAQTAALATRQQIDLIPSRKAGLEAQQAAATAQRDTAKANVTRSTITSPIDGIIEMLDIEVGENLAPGQRVARIIDPRVIELPLQLPASARSYVTTGNQATLTTRSHPDDCPPWEAKITRLSIVDNPTRTFTAFAEVDQSDIPLRHFAQGSMPHHKLPAGAFTMAKLDTAEPQQQTVLPARSIQEGRIRTVVDGKIVGQVVDVAFDLEGNFPQFGTEDTQWVALKQPLPRGTLVVISASMTILDGQNVEPKVTNKEASIDADGVSP